jgi:hypothetical protein
MKNTCISMPTSSLARQIFIIIKMFPTNKEVCKYKVYTQCIFSFHGTVLEVIEQRERYAYIS